MMRPRFLAFFHDRGHFRRFLYGMAAVACLTGLGVLFIPQAWAAFGCSHGLPTGNLFSQDTVSNIIYDSSGSSYTVTVPTSNVNGNPYGATGACRANLGIFGSVLCFFKASVGQIVSTMYCGFQAQLKGPLSIALELFLVVSGVAIMTGMTNFTAREGITVLLKIAVVWAFAMNADWGIGIAYGFFMGLAEQGTNIILGSWSGTPPSGGAYLTQIDKIFNNVANMTSSVSTVGSTMFGVNIGTGAGQVPPQCLAWIIPILVALFLFFPLVAGFIFGLITQYVLLYARALLGYLTSLVLISFLFVLSPLFIGFALFQSTRKLFDQWLGYLTSFSLQMIFVFAFMVLLDLVPIGDFFTEILSLLRADPTVTQQGPYMNPTAFCAICDFTVDYSASLGSTPEPISCIAGSTKINPLRTLYTTPDLFQVIISQIIALWIIGEIMHDFLKRAPQIARDLAGRMQFAALLGGGAESGGPTVDYMGLNSLEQKFEEMKRGISSSRAFRGSVLGRALPVVASVAGVELLNRSLSRRANTKLSGTSADADMSAEAAAGTAAGRGSGIRSASKTVLGAASVSAANDGDDAATASPSRTVARSDAASSNMRRSNDEKGDSAKPAARGLLRMPLINMRNFDYIAAEMKQVADRDDMNESYDNVQRELHNFENAQKYSDEAERKNAVIERTGNANQKQAAWNDLEEARHSLAEARESLSKAREHYLDSTATLYETQQDLLRENLGLQSKKSYFPEEEPLFDLQGKAADGESQGSGSSGSAEHMRSAMASAQELQGKLKPQDARKMIDDAAKSLQMQINVQGILGSSEDAAKSQVLLDQALSDYAQTRSEDGDGLEKVLQQFYVLQRSLA